MKIRAQIAMVLNLDKCIGCHTCSVTCKNVWTSREGMEYAWFNNVETKPGIGYPKDWENQKRWNGGWVRKKNGKIEPRIGSKWRVLANIFAKPTQKANLIKSGLMTFAKVSVAVAFLACLLGALAGRINWRWVAIVFIVAITIATFDLLLGFLEVQ